MFPKVFLYINQGSLISLEDIFLSLFSLNEDPVSSTHSQSVFNFFNYPSLIAEFSAEFCLNNLSLKGSQTPLVINDSPPPMCFPLNLSVSTGCVN